MTKKEKAALKSIERSVAYWREYFRSLPDGAQYAIEEALQYLRKLSK